MHLLNHDPEKMKDIEQDLTEALDKLSEKNESAEKFLQEFLIEGASDPAQGNQPQA